MRCFLGEATQNNVKYERMYERSNTYPGYCIFFDEKIKFQLLPMLQRKAYPNELLTQSNW